MALTRQEVMIIVNRWIGVSGGYLGDFSYRTHREFYPEYCGVDANPDELEGTTRERFTELVSALPAPDQARVIRGVLERFPTDTADAPTTRTQDLEQRLLRIAERLERRGGVAAPSAEVSSEAVRRALADAETLLGTAEAGNAVDRIHTALHGYLIAVAEEADLDLEADAAITSLFRELRRNHPALLEHGPRAGDVTAVLNAMATIVDRLQPVRNRASLAHPNRELLADAEAMLVINAARTVFRYLQMRLEEAAA